MDLFYLSFSKAYGSSEKTADFYQWALLSEGRAERVNFTYDGDTPLLHF